MNLNGVKALPNGNVIDLRKPSEYTFTVEEIASLLAEVKRFNGYGISVASHSIWVAHTLFRLTGNPHIALLGLFHDAQEGYIGDIATPVKELVGSEWDKLETAINLEILSQLNIKHELNLATMPLVKLVDMVALYHEVQLLVEQGIYTLDKQGVWETTFKDIKPLNSELHICEQTSPAYSFTFVYKLYKSICGSDNVCTYVEQTYTTKDGKYTCMVEENTLHIFQQELGA